VADEAAVCFPQELMAIAETTRAKRKEITLMIFMRPPIDLSSIRQLS
jgi:hypothetical protein